MRWPRSLALTSLIAALLAAAGVHAEVEPLDAQPGLTDALTFRLGGAAAQIRDLHASALRYGGPSGRVGIGLESFDVEWLDQLELTAHRGDLTSGGSLELARWGASIDWRLAPEVWGRGSGGLHVGGRWHTAVDLRDGFVSSWDSRSTLEAEVSWRHRVALGGHRLWLDAGIGGPVVGALLRPGYASPLVGRSLDAGDTIFAAPHNLRGVRLVAGGWWLRPEGAPLQLRLGWYREHITEPHVAERSELTLDLAFAWSL